MQRAEETTLYFTFCTDCLFLTVVTKLAYLILSCPIYLLELLGDHSLNNQYDFKER